ncbi:DUF488 domain-containing protein [Bacillus swezeyi]|uniref:DUF488 domain-containing protein n=1 Tax=Bacillus swezeyi TaxID=1925020 RepID=A0A5M8RJK9_9BACI|nr:DUF488 domain-containing protein [Bacillus swezeyi]KAA6447610.1 DUF488 domain-containing protein [Bacillus swezeyi]KAA6474016.1 DUF488 domain-containing protein [Bacillus swezeyi]MED1742240.1 DUF488 domain-containing protein [Bacillus swezeyi]TYS34190.1 DUF488 domain-containing protein [Bacillus swezeyi]
MPIILQRIYHENPQSEGRRILIDRVWPRGISKEKAKLDDWMKEIAPSPDLRKWFDHDPKKFAAFQQAYKDEIKQDALKQAKLKELRDMAREENLTLLYGAKDEVHNHAVVLKEILESCSDL